MMGLKEGSKQIRSICETTGPTDYTDSVGYVTLDMYIWKFWRSNSIASPTTGMVVNECLAGINGYTHIAAVALLVLAVHVIC